MHAKGKRPPLAVRLTGLILAALFLVVGIILVFIPGPAVVFFALAGAMLAAESRPVARFLDWSELRIRSGVGWVRRFWAQLSTWGRVAVGILLCGCGAGLGFVAYKILFS